MDDSGPETLPVDDGRDGTGRESTPPGVDSLADPVGAAKEEQARRKAEEQAWIRRAQAGDEEAFAWLVRTHEMRAFRVARGLIANEEDARDVAQEAFLRVFRSLERFDFGYAFSTWLHRIVTNLAIDHLRKRRVVAKGGLLDDEESRAPELVDEGVEDPSAGLERGETVDEVHRCLEALAPHFQSVLVLRELEGLSCAEIAEIVGATNVTVRWRLHRGRKLFQEEWERRERLSQQGARESMGSANAAPLPPVEHENDGEDPGDQ